jgi:hypothetical protein
MKLSFPRFPESGHKNAGAYSRQKQKRETMGKCPTLQDDGIRA